MPAPEILSANNQPKLLLTAYKTQLKLILILPGDS